MHRALRHTFLKLGLWMQVYGYPTIESSERNKQWDFTEIISNHFVLPALIQQKLPQFIYTALIFYLTLHAKIVNSN